MSAANYPAEYLQGIEHFNAHQFFEAHEVWEAIWKSSPGPNQLFYKGLIHAAVALHHFGNGNLHGARKVFGSCVQYLEPYAPAHLGLDLRGFLGQLRKCCAGLEGPGHQSDRVKLDATQIPRIVLQPPPEAAARGGAA